MSDTPAPQAPEAPKPTPPSTEGGKPEETGTGTPPEAPSQETTDWKSEARKWEERAKQNNSAAARLAEIEEANKTEAQKQAEALEKTQSELKQYKEREQVQTWAQEITKDSHVPASALRGSTEEELREHFELLKSLITAPERPTSDPVPSIHGTPPAPGNVTITDQIKAAEASGNKELVSALKAIQLSSS